jgi:hypothetical protein
MRPRHPRLIALFALVALAFATTAYVAHGFQDGTVRQHASVQCDLCLQFSGTAGAPADLGLPGKPPLVVVRTTPVELPPLPVDAEDGEPLPRGPPALT